MSCTRETIDWKREAYEHSGEIDTALVDGGRVVHFFMAEKIVVADATGGIAFFDWDSVCPGADVLGGAVDVSAVVASQICSQESTRDNSRQFRGGEATTLFVCHLAKKRENRRWGGRG